MMGEQRDKNRPLHEDGFRESESGKLTRDAHRGGIDVRARQVIGQCLAEGRCSRDEIARELNLHPRTLQRRLSENGVSFASLVDMHKRELALKLVTQSAMSLSRVASALGYADQSTFNQAFRRWTKTTPTAFRQSVMARPEKKGAPGTSGD